MAFTFTVIQLTFGVICSAFGIFINKVFVGVTSTNLTNMYVLSLINLGSKLYLLLLIQLIPLRKDVKKYADETSKIKENENENELEME